MLNHDKDNLVNRDSPKTILDTGVIDPRMCDYVSHLNQIVKFFTGVADVIQLDIKPTGV